MDMIALLKPFSFLSELNQIYNNNWINNDLAPQI